MGREATGVGGLGDAGGSSADQKGDGGVGAANRFTDGREAGWVP